MLQLLHRDFFPTQSSHCSVEADMRLCALKKNLAELGVLSVAVGAKIVGNVEREALSHL